MRKKMSLLVVGLLLAVQILQGFGFAAGASAEETAAAERAAETSGPEQTETPGQTQGISEPDQAQDHAEEAAPETGGGEEAVDPDAAAQAQEEEVSALAEEEREAAQIKENLLTNVDLKIRNGAGEYVPVDNGVVYDQNAGVEVYYEWALPNGHGYKGGDWFVFRLPEQFVLAGSLSGDLKWGEGSVGTFTIDKDTLEVKMTFNDSIAEYDDVSGTLYAETTFNKQKFTNSTEQTIVFPIGSGEKKVSVKIKPAVDKAIVKKGVFRKDENGKEIAWTIDFNQTLAEVRDARLTDVVPAGLTLQPDSIKVTRLNVNMDGTVTPEGEFTAYKVSKTQDGKDFELTFDSGGIDSAYRVEYSTGVDDGFEGTKKFVNTAVLSGSNTESLSADASVEVTVGRLLDKKMTKYNSETQQVDWKVYYNYGQNRIAAGDAVLKDLFNGTQELVGGTAGIKVSSVNPLGERGEEGKQEIGSSEYSVTPIAGENGQNGFELRFAKEISSAYVIEYSTRAGNPVYNVNKETVVNTVTSGDKSASDQVGIGQVFGIKSYVKANDNYANKTVGWKIELNHNKLPMNGVTITDNFPNSGLELLPDSLVVNKIVNGKVSGKLTLGDDYTLVPAQGGDYAQGFAIAFADTLRDEYSIEYNTRFNLDTLQAGKTFFRNQAVVKWTDEAGQEQSVTTSADFTPNAATLANGSKFGSYNAASKKITWTVNVNYNLKQLAQASIVDTLTNGQSMGVEELNSLRVFEMKIAPGGQISKETEVPKTGYEAAYDKDGGKLTVSFKQPIDTGYILIFDTTLDGAVTTGRIPNTAVLTDGAAAVSKPLTSAVTVVQGGEFVAKTGEQSKEDQDAIDWTVWINRGQSTVDKAVLTDKPSADQVILKDSFKLYAANVAQNGAVTKNADRLLQAGTDYKVDVTVDENGAESFVLGFAKQISTPYVLEYQTLTNAKNGTKVSNALSFIGENVNKVSQETGKEVLVARSSGGGTGSGVYYRLSVLKVEEGAASTLLEGAEFKLERVRNGKSTLIGNNVTDAQGKLVFTKLLSGDYILTETKAPNGYELELDENGQPLGIPVTINGANAGEDLVVEKEVANKKMPATPTDPGTPPVDPGTPPTDPGTPPGPGTPPVDPQPPVNPGPPVDPGPPVTPTPEPPVPVQPTPETPTPNTPGLILPEFPLPAPLINLPEGGTPSGGLDVEPAPSTPVQPEPTPVTPEPAAPVESGPVTPPDNGIEITDETPQGGLDVTPDPASVPAQPSPVYSPDGSVPGAAVVIEGGVLPQTGETGSLPTRAAGFALLLLGLTGFLLVRRSDAQKQD
ncbi:collagen binding domain-containing protein [Saccharibacillus sp. CPCC 101409]|uniref:collagen binding domain-containing protein n=1 Tax=Saccharibacillus sp. CPCC 101409 TaxID=3058041 RepID=UPI0026719BB0|nr:collagen binding domain-containing protein [Saccharibacillus sp. CPCC 101409]MDO3408185.1 collagen binding domain-containing protein [Saccharibacillus sp. CPCC 101409]